MIITRLEGGLGNQMFEYACGRRTSLQLGEILKLDISTLQESGNSASDTPRKYSLDHFNITANFATTEEIRMLKSKFQLGGKLLDKTCTMLGFALHKPTADEIVKKEIKYLTGFWQDENYFKDIEETIRKDFTIRNPLSGEAEEISCEIKSSKNSVSIHVRRGDYITNSQASKHHGLCSPLYYQKALTFLLSKLENKNIELFIFSDDIEWVKTNLQFPHKMTYIPETKIPDYEALILMSKCAHNIIANSSFSWWGAWLNQNPDKIVIAPEKWFANPVANKNQSIVPKSWIRI